MSFNKNQYNAPLDPRLIEEVAKDILVTSDLWDELDQLGVDIAELAFAVARAIDRRDRWEAVQKEKQRAKDRYKKVERKWRRKSENDYDREKHLSELTDVLARVESAKADAAIVKSGVTTKKRPYMHELIKNLEKILRPRTPHPYRYMAALFNLFNLHPESFCEKCNGFYQTASRCGRSHILLCPNHRKARDKIGKMARRMRQNELKPTESC